LALNIRTYLWGGKRPGAGRKKKAGGHDSPHRRRENVTASTPVHVTLRTRSDVGRLRRRKVYRAIHRAMRKVLGPPDFRIVHASIQHNHLHLIVEADHNDALADGMQGFTISVAKAINAIQGREGKVFAYRFHSTNLTSPRQTIAYVLNNWRRHNEDVKSL